MLKLALTMSLALTLGSTGYFVGKKQVREVEGALLAQARSLQLLTSEVAQVKLACNRPLAVAASELDTNRIAEVVEQHLASVRPACDPNAPERGKGNDTPRENPDKVLEGRQIVAKAVESGVWTGDDANRLRVLGESLSSAEYGSLAQDVAAKLNRGDLRYDGSKAPF